MFLDYIVNHIRREVFPHIDPQTYSVDVLVPDPEIADFTNVIIITGIDPDQIFTDIDNDMDRFVESRYAKGLALLDAMIDITSIDSDDVVISIEFNRL